MKPMTQRLADKGWTQTAANRWHKSGKFSFSTAIHLSFNDSWTFVRCTNSEYGEWESGGLRVKSEA